MKTKLVHNDSPSKLDEYELIKGIETFDEFIEVYTSKDTGKFDGKQNRIKEKLLQIKGFLIKNKSNIKNPIKYLRNIYFIKQISIRDIVSELDTIGITYKASSLSNLYTNTLGITLRGNTESTESSKKKNIIKGKTSWLNKQKALETQDAIQEILNNNNGVDIGFDLIKFIKEKNKNKATKIIYLLYTFSFIKKENINELYLFVSRLNKGGLGAHRISTILDTIINTYIIQNNKLKVAKFHVDEKFSHSKNFHISVPKLSLT